MGQVLVVNFWKFIDIEEIFKSYVTGNPSLGSNFQEAKNKKLLSFFFVSVNTSIKVEKNLFFFS